MIKKKIQIPIYNCDLTIIYDNDLSYICEKYRTRPLTNYGAVVLRDPWRPFHYIVAFTHSKEGIIAHEVVHLVNHIFKDRGVELDLENDESQAYLTGWLYDKIEKTLKQ
jgi:hypothetical protein